MWQGFSTQHYLLVMIEKLRKIRYEKGGFGVVLPDLSKAFYYILHKLPIAKLSAYGFDMKSIAFYFRVSQKPKAWKKKWVHLQRMFEYIIWCSTWFYFGTSFISDIYCKSFLSELWSRFCKLCWWHHPYICGQEFSTIINVLEKNVKTNSGKS